ncbi:hypothetical protein SAMN05421752_1051, partial [Natronorubrum thiooxidans]
MIDRRIEIAGIDDGEHTDGCCNGHCLHDRYAQYARRNQCNRKRNRDDREEEIVPGCRGENVDQCVKRIPLGTTNWFLVLDVLLRLKSQESRGTAPLRWEFQVCNPTRHQSSENLNGARGLAGGVNWERQTPGTP